MPSIVKVPGDVPLGNVSLGKGMLFGNVGQRLVKFWYLMLRNLKFEGFYFGDGEKLTILAKKSQLMALLTKTLV